MIQLENAVASINGRQVFGPISVHLSEQRIGCVGRNGSGKSSLVRAIAGLLPIETGTLRVNGYDPAQDRKSTINDIGILFQNPDHQIIFPTVEEEIGFGLRQQGQSKAEVSQNVSAILAQFGREDWAKRSIATLSQGQRHLLCLMAVLVMRPKAILLDEPFTGLDLATRRALTRHLSGLPQRIIHVTHQTEDIADYDRVLWIEDGAIKMDGPAEAIISAYTQDAMAGGQDAFTDL
jgi:biotin transport system ATP-binding protein